jgi:YfiH family protein
MPILFSDPEARVVGAAHAGWKGALAGVAEETITAMERIGAKRSRIRVVIGPCISQSAYEVGPEFRETFISKNPANERHFHLPPGRERPTFNLSGYMIDRLKTTEVLSVVRVGGCTYSSPELYFSARRSKHNNEGGFGEHIAAIMI